MFIKRSQGVEVVNDNAYNELIISCRFCEADPNMGMDSAFGPKIRSSDPARRAKRG